MSVETICYFVAPSRRLNVFLFLAVEDDYCPLQKHCSISRSVDEEKDAFSGGAKNSNAALPIGAYL